MLFDAWLVGIGEELRKGRFVTAVRYQAKVCPRVHMSARVLGVRDRQVMAEQCANWRRKADIRDNCLQVPANEPI